jgi:hypothetical protein
LRLIKNYNQQIVIKKIEGLNRISKLFEFNNEKQKISSFYYLLNKIKFKKDKNISVRHLRNISKTKSEMELQSLPTMIGSLSDSYRNLQNGITKFYNHSDLSNFNIRKNKEINNVQNYDKKGLYFNQENKLTSLEKNLRNNLAECTFQPNLKLKKPKSPERDIFSDLYNESKVLKEKKNKKIIDYLKFEGRSYSFSPNIKENLNNRSFTDFQIRNDKVILNFKL